jgi:hypothetical protein
MIHLVNWIWSHPYLTEELHNLYSSPNVIRVIKSRRARDIARIRKRRITYRVLVEKPEGNNPL